MIRPLRRGHVWACLKGESYQSTGYPHRPRGWYRLTGWVPQSPLRRQMSRGTLLRDRLDTGKCPCRCRWDMWKADFDGYIRRLDADEYRRKRQDVPHDSSELLRLAREIDLIDRFSVALSEKAW